MTSSKTKREKKRPYDLVVVAHPDDEIIFFGGLLISTPESNWKVICVTDGDADGQGALRKDQFSRALKMARVKDFEMWEHPDIYEKRIDLVSLQNQLSDLPTPRRIFTHGPIGEYGHPHHQDVCRAVYAAFKGHRHIWSPAYNCAAKLRLNLSASVYKKKCEILKTVYFSETSRFSWFLPASNTEGYQQFSLEEVQEIYRFILGDNPVRLNKIQNYKWYVPYLREISGKKSVRQI